MNIQPKSILSVMFLICALSVAANGEKTVVALNPLSAEGDLSQQRELISDILQAKLSTSKTIKLVDRDRMHDALNELKLAKQGMVTSTSAAELGEIVGAEYFCSGKLSQGGDTTMAIVRVMEIETTLVKLSYAKFQDSGNPEKAAQELATGVEELIATFEAEKEQRSEQEKTAVKKIPEDWTLPTVIVVIPEQHIRPVPQGVVIDPAAETEITERLLDSGFDVIDSAYVKLKKRELDRVPRNTRLAERLVTVKTAREYAAEKNADVLLYGEAISERGTGLNDFEGCRARVELKAIAVDSNRVLVADSQHAGATGLSETIAGKKAIKTATAELGKTFLFKLAEKWNQR